MQFAAAAVFPSVVYVIFHIISVLLTINTA